MELQLDEALDENTSTYPVINLKPKQKIPQTWKFNVPGNDSLMGRLVSFASEGDAVKNVKMGDKYAQFFLLSLTGKGNATELKGGLGSDPRGAIVTIFDTIYESMIRCRFDAVLFRLPIRKLKGQHKAVQRILSRLLDTRTGGRYVVLKEMWDYSSKYAYVLVKRKSVLLEDIPGLPKVSDELFTKVETQVGTTYVDKKTGQAVDKDTAFAASIANLEDNRSSDRAIAAKIRISRREVMMAQYSNMESTKDWKPEARARQEELNANPPVHEATGMYNSAIGTVIFKAKDSVVAENRKLLSSLDAFTDLSHDERLENENHRESRAIYRSILKHVNQFNENPMIDTPRSVQDREYMALAGVRQYYQAVNKFNGNNYLEVYRDIASIVLPQYGKNEITGDQRNEFIKDLIVDFTDKTTAKTRDAYSMQSSLLKGELNGTTSEGRAVKTYTGSAYGDINDFLIGSYGDNASTQIKRIENLDRAFEKGVKLPNNTKLFRGMSAKITPFENMIRNKIFYFSNFVSTSLAPVFAGMYGFTVPALDQSVGLEMDVDDADTSDFKARPLVQSPLSRIQIGMVISGADKIKVIVPGELSEHVSECEVILPRGTAIRINKLWTAQEGMSQGKAILEATVIAPEQIDESTEMYDGDTLINEGEIKSFSFSRFLTESDEEGVGIEVEDDEFFEPVVQVKKEVVEYDPAMAILASMIDLDQLPEKFR